ncbi:hypothetical protein ACFGVS_16050 [Mucilaginibacter sp. AW1-7]|uniref:hypothetical protein n=1 Tax=Mucilaginibacter sp. AW1-7 TaxID=3349874 RepID=UPI003F73636C
MKSFFMLMLAVLFTAFSSYAQNTFPATGNAGIGTTSPATNLHIVGSGTNTDGDNAHSVNGGGVIIQGNTGARSASTGAQLEFAIPANTDGTNIWGQGRIITVAGNLNNGNATGKMIIGTRRSFNKLGTGAQWYYGNDLVVDGAGNIGIGMIAPVSRLQVNEPTDSKPGGVLAPTKTVFKLSRLGTSNYSYNESAEFRIGHGGPSVWGSKLELFVNGASNQTDIPDQQVMTWLYNGNVGIGTSTPQETLSVNGNIRSKQVKVETANWPDYVFKKDYQLPSLTDVKNYIDENQHLPGMPSEAEVAKDGLNLGEMNKLLVKKVEELTLYLIEKEKKEKAQSETNQALETRLQKQQAQIDLLQKQMQSLTE